MILIFNLILKIWAASNTKGKYPLVFIEDRFIGLVDVLEDANEDGELKALLA